MRKRAGYWLKRNFYGIGISSKVCEMKAIGRGTTNSSKSSQHD